MPPIEVLKQEAKSHRETLSVPAEKRGEVFADAAKIFYFHKLPPELRQELGSMVVEAFQNSENENSSELIEAGMWKEGFRLKPVKDESLPKLYNPAWSCEYPPINMNPVEVYTNMLGEGRRVLNSPEDSKQFKEWQNSSGQPC